MSKKFVPQMITWFGGKGSMISKIVPLVNAVQHQTYVEPFGGGAAILLQKNSSPVEVYNDLDERLYDLFKVISDRKLFADFQRIVSVLPVSRQLFLEFRDGFAKEKDPVKRAAMWFLAARQSFSGTAGRSWSYGRTVSHCSKWLNCIAGLERIHWRLVCCQIESDDFRNILKNYDSPDTLFYCDPPYVTSTRRSGGYAHEMSDDDHKDLLNSLVAAEGVSIISGYESELYTSILGENGWGKVLFETACRASGYTRGTGILGEGSAMRSQKRTEVLYIHTRIVPTAKRIGYVVNNVGSESDLVDSDKCARKPLPARRL
jgi:DNA adenine methylase